MVHCTISQCGISKLSFLVAGYALNCYNYIRFLHTAIIPFIHQLHSNECYWMDGLAMDGPSDCPLCQQHAGFPPAIKNLLCPQGCKLTMRRFTVAGQIFQGRAQKGCLWWRMGGNFNPGAKAEHQGKGSSNSPSNDPLSLQHVGSLHSRWLLGGLLLAIKLRPIRH